MKEEYFSEEDVSRLQKPQSPLGLVSISCLGLFLKVLVGEKNIKKINYEKKPNPIRN